MKKLVIVLFLIAVACSPKPEATPAAMAETRFVLSKVTETFAPTPTPVVLTPTPTPSAMPTPIPTITIESYVVQPGDTLTDIAARFGLNVNHLAGINNIPDQDRIFVGQVLKLTGVVEVPTPEDAGKQIIVKLSVQTVFVYENDVLVKTFLVSTGMKDYPTRVGDYKIWIKLPSTRMTGPGYDLSDVLWTMYFDEGRGFHGKYWNNIYGRPSSHGCVNMTNDDAKWLYDWAYVGTHVSVIP